MSFTPVKTVSNGEAWTAKDHNTYVRDNFAAGVPDIFTAKGDIAIGTGVDACTRLPVGVNGEYLSSTPNAALGVNWASTAVGMCAQVNDTQMTTYDAWALFTTNPSEDFDVHADFANRTFTIPVSGIYLVGCHMLYGMYSGSKEADSELRVGTYVNGALKTVLGVYVSQCAGGTGAMPLNGNDILKLSKGDTVQFWFWNNGDASHTFKSQSGSWSRVWIARII